MSEPEIRGREKFNFDLPGTEEMERRLLEKSDPNKTEQQTVPGMYEFDSPQVLYTIYSSFFGDENARKEVAHEVEHLAVYKKYNIPCGFGIALSRIGENGIWGVGLLIPHFPNVFDEEKRKTIMHEANLAVTHQSPRDAEAIKKIETSSGALQTRSSNPLSV